MSNWFPKKNRGFLVGLWSTSSSVGNSLAGYVYNGLALAFGDKWAYYPLFSSGICTFVALMNVIFLYPDPTKIGIIIEEETEEEQFIRVISETLNSKEVRKTHESASMNFLTRLSQQLSVKSLGGVSAGEEFVKEIKERNKQISAELR